MWWDNWEEGEDYGSRDWNFFPNGEVELFSLVAQVTYDSLEGAYDEDGEIDLEKLHWVAGNSVRLEVHSHGRLSVPAATVQEEVCRGDFLQVHVEEVENAQYRIDIS